MLTIKNLKIPSSVIQSPMAGCTDLAFRLIARRHGMEFAFLEMISADALTRQNRKTLGIMKSRTEDRPLGAQLVGCNPDTMGDAAQIVEELGYDLLDLNLGCPVPKIVSPGAGSALLAEPEKCRNIFRRVVRRVRDIPVTVKMRKGFSDVSGEEAVRISKIAEDEGLSAVAVHGRTRVQGYTGAADWEAIGKVKKAVKIPVIGNGDVNSPEDALKLRKVSGCDGVMLGRGALGNPWIYRSIGAAMNHETPVNKPCLEEIKKTARDHFELSIETEGEELAVLKARKMLCWYFKGLPGASELRNTINRTHSVDEMRSHIDNFGSNA